LITDTEAIFRAWIPPPDFQLTANVQAKLLLSAVHLVIAPIFNFNYLVINLAFIFLLNSLSAMI